MCPRAVRRSKGVGAVVLPGHRRDLHLLVTPPNLSGGTYTRNLADGDGETIWSEELRRGHSHATLLCLPAVFLDLLWEAPGSAQATAPLTHRDTDTNRPTQKDTRGTPGGRVTTSQSPQDPRRASELDHTHPNPVPRLNLQGETTTQGSVAQIGSANPVGPPGPWHSTLTWYLRSKAWFFLRRATILRSSSASFSSCLLIGDWAP